MALEDETPLPGDVFRHSETDDLVEFIGVGDGDYEFSVNRGERKMELPTEDWSTYNEFLDRQPDPLK